MAPARMVSFMEQHVTTCATCQQDPLLNEEIAKITTLILPESKIPKAVRLRNGKLAKGESVNDKKTNNEEVKKGIIPNSSGVLSSSLQS